MKVSLAYNLIYLMAVQAQNPAANFAWWYKFSMANFQAGRLAINQDNGDVYVTGHFSSTKTNTIFTAKLPQNGSTIFTKEDSRNSLSAAVSNTFISGTTFKVFGVLKGTSTYFGRSYNLDESNSTVTGAYSVATASDVVADSQDGYAIWGLTQPQSNFYDLRMFSSSGTFKQSFAATVVGGPSKDVSIIGAAYLPSTPGTLFAAITDFSSSNDKLILFKFLDSSSTPTTYELVSTGYNKVGSDKVRFAFDETNEIMYICGNTAGSHSIFGTSLNGQGVYIGKFNLTSLSGTPLDAVFIDTAGSETLGGCIVDPSSKDLIVFGTTTGTLGTRTTNAGVQDVFVARYASGNFSRTGMMQYSATGANANTINDLVLESTGRNLYILFTGSAGIGGISSGSSSVYLASLPLEERGSLAGSAVSPVAVDLNGNPLETTTTSNVVSTTTSVSSSTPLATSSTPAAQITSTSTSAKITTTTTSKLTTTTSRATTTTSRVTTTTSRATTTTSRVTTTTSRATSTTSKATTTTSRIATTTAPRVTTSVLPSNASSTHLETTVSAHIDTTTSIAESTPELNSNFSTISDIVNLQSTVSDLPPSSEVSSDLPQTSVEPSTETSASIISSTSSRPDLNQFMALVDQALSQYFWIAAGAVAIILFMISFTCVCCCCGRKRKAKAPAKTANEQKYVPFSQFSNSYTNTASTSSMEQTRAIEPSTDDAIRGGPELYEKGDGATGLDELDALAADLDAKFDDPVV